MKLVTALTLTLLTTTSQATVVFFNSPASFATAATTSLVDNFEGFAQPDTNIFGPIVRNGLTYSPLSPSNNLRITGATTVYTNFGVNLSPFSGTVLTSSGPERIRVTLQTPATAAGFDGYLNGLGAGTVEVFNGSSLLSTFDLPNPVGGAKIFVGFTSSTPFTSFVWATTDGEIRNTAIDTIQIGSAVPEPSTLLLLAIGAVIVLAASTRGKQEIAV